VDLFDEREESVDKAVIFEIETMMMSMQHGLTTDIPLTVTGKHGPKGAQVNLGMRQLNTDEDDEQLMQHILEDLTF